MNCQLRGFSAERLPNKPAHFFDISVRSLRGDSLYIIQVNRHWNYYTGKTAMPEGGLKIICG
jgi:hypothetical protein